jgi:hypothetical protein
MSVCKAALVSGLLTLVCSGTAWAAVQAPRGVVALWTGDDQWVRLERQDDPVALPNDHPAPLETAAVARALGALRIRIVDQDNGTETQRAVFTQEELGNLAAPVAAGLAKAGPKQDVTFSTLGNHPRAAGSFMKDIFVNAGRIFYAGGKLNVIFGELQTDYRKKNIYGRADEDFEARRQGMRRQASKLRSTLATLPGIALHTTSDGSVRNDWVMIDPAVAGSQTPAATQAAEAAPEPRSSPPPARVAAPAPVVESATGAAAATAPAPAPATAKSAADLERRLRTLKDLRDKGLISEEIYNAKVKELLAEL